MSTDTELKAICEHFGVPKHGYCANRKRIVIPRAGGNCPNCDGPVFGSFYPDPRTDNDAAVKLLEKMPGRKIWFDETWRCGAYINEADSFGQAVYNAAKEDWEMAVQQQAQEGGDA